MALGGFVGGGGMVAGGQVTDDEDVQEEVLVLLIGRHVTDDLFGNMEAERW